MIGIPGAPNLFEDFDPGELISNAFQPDVDALAAWFLPDMCQPECFGPPPDEHHLCYTLFRTVDVDTPLNAYTSAALGRTHDAEEVAGADNLASFPADREHDARHKESDVPHAANRAVLAYPVLRSEARLRQRHGSVGCNHDAAVCQTRRDYCDIRGMATGDP